MSNKQSTSDFLKELNIDQLYRAVEIAREIIRDIESQEKVKLIVVTDGILNVGCFAIDDFEKAKEKLCDLIMKDKFDLRKVKHRECPSMSIETVYESEVEGMMALNG